MAEPLASVAARALTEAERFDWLRLARSENIGPRTFRVLLDRYGAAAAALEALPDLIARGRPGRPIRLATFEDIERELEAMRRAGAVLIGFCEPAYPALLRRIDAAPPLIALRGSLACLARSKVAIVGSRNASAAGLAFTEQIARGVGRAGHVVVSGLARGIDARAHQATIETGTIAVLVGGLGNIYPTDHAGLLERLVDQGAAISEMPFGWEARGRDFPRRNRIVAGLSRGVVVIEAARRSGSLITARFAAEQGREIFAAPGSPLDPRAEGTNDLLRDGATFCTSAQDVIEALAKQDWDLDEHFSLFEPGLAEGLDAPLWEELDLPGEAGAALDASADPTLRDLAPPRAIRSPTPVEAPGPWTVPAETRPAPSPTDLAARVVELLGPTPVSVDELVRASEGQAREVRAILLELELAGRLEWRGGDLVAMLGNFQPRGDSGGRAS
ncbi:DNA-processing protein DprA [Methylocapsa acidiphila]|uniref:DNA-processing protein DprA n=1 Tax=Methylocapsa acidiphila TaxID=133552 RepID=UPI00042A23FA|nr:DNA-processing protein DprA [Methylocapsa acidiphila]